MAGFWRFLSLRLAQEMGRDFASHAFQTHPLFGTSISFARSPAVSWNRIRGRIASYSSCSGHNVHCLIFVHSSVRSRRGRFGPGIFPCLSLKRRLLQAYSTPQKFARIRGILSQFGLPSRVKSLMARSLRCHLDCCVTRYGINLLVSLYVPIRSGRLNGEVFPSRWEARKD